MVAGATISTPRPHDRPERRMRGPACPEAARGRASLRGLRYGRRRAPAAITAPMIAAPAPSPPTRVTRARECAASRLWTKPPSDRRSNGAPRAVRARTAAGPSRVSTSTAAGSQRPAPAARVSAACRAGSSSSPRATAMPPCAQPDEQPSPSGDGGKDQHRPGGGGQGGGKARQAGADDQDAVEGGALGHDRLRSALCPRGGAP